MKKTIAILLLAAVFLIAGCSGSGIKTTEDLNGKTIAVPSGTTTEQTVSAIVSDATYAHYGSAKDCVQAVLDGEADAAAFDEPIMKSIVSQTSGVRILDELLTEDNYGYAVHGNNRDLQTAINDLLTEISGNGVFDEMEKRWFPESGAPGEMPDFETVNENGMLYFGTSTVTSPFAFIDASGNYAGFDVEFAYRLAQAMGRELVIVDLEYGSLIPQVMAQDVNMAGACLTITEGDQRVAFSNPYMSGGIAVVVAK